MSSNRSVREWLKRRARRALVEAAPSSDYRGDHAITYHRIGRAVPDVSWVTERAFLEQMQFLAVCCEVLTPESLAVARDGGDPDMPRVCITVDDGHISAASIAAPILSDRGLGAVFFIPTDAIGRRGQLSRRDIRELSDAGFEIGSHSCSHRSMPSLSEREREREVIESKRVLEDITGRPVTTFAYPFGTRTDFGAATDRLLAAAGYDRAFTAQHGPIGLATHPLRTPRVKIEASDSIATFAKVVAGAADGWGWVDRYFYWLQRGPHRRPVAT